MGRQTLMLGAESQLRDEISTLDPYWSKGSFDIDNYFEDPIVMDIINRRLFELDRLGYPIDELESLYQATKLKRMTN